LPGNSKNTKIVRTGVPDFAIFAIPDPPNMKIPAFLSAILLIIIVSGCQHPSVYDCTGITPTYNHEVKPILDSYCAMPGMGCHAADHSAGGIDLGTYAGASGESKNKRFLGTIEHLKWYTEMPKGGTILPDAHIHILSCWVENGSPE
jgi:hypothetical protein